MCCFLWEGDYFQFTHFSDTTEEILMVKYFSFTNLTPAKRPINTSCNLPLKKSKESINQHIALENNRWQFPKYLEYGRLVFWCFLCFVLFLFIMFQFGLLLEILFSTRFMVGLLLATFSSGSIFLSLFVFLVKFCVLL